jgi:hypothetical protein
MTPGIQGAADVVLKQTTYERLKTSYRRWHSDFTDIVEQQ